MDFVSAWKAVSIAFTGAFGLLALLTENKHKETGRLTRWGKLSFGGIILSTGFGALAQLKETSDEAAGREAISNQTLTLVKQTGDAVTDIQRLLSPLEVSRVSIAFRFSCQGRALILYWWPAAELPSVRSASEVGSISRP